MNGVSRHRDLRRDDDLGAARGVEAERQQQLLAGVLAARADASTLPLREGGARALRGLQAYRVNADACATRALATAFATLHMLLGEENFEQLAREFWRAEPPLRGDLGEWGESLPAWIATHTQLLAWPYLADCAKLDWALHACERAADAALDGESMARLGDTDPSRLRLEPMPGLVLIESAWPIALIHEVHRAHPPDETAFDALREAIAEPRAERVVVARRGWKAESTCVDAGTAAWTRAMLAGDDLACALERAPGSVDFSTWLATALQRNWVKGIRVLSD